MNKWIDLRNWRTEKYVHGLNGDECAWRVVADGEDTAGNPITVLLADWLDQGMAEFLAASRDMYAALFEVTDAYWGVNDDHAGDGGKPPTLIVTARAALRRADPA